MKIYAVSELAKDVLETVDNLGKNSYIYLFTLSLR